MAHLTPERSNVRPFADHMRQPDRARDGHGWLVPHLISLIGYAERHGLSDVEKALAEAAERIAPKVQIPAAPAASAGCLVFPSPPRKDGQS